jgi:hypothetical protein
MLEYCQISKTPLSYDHWMNPSSSVSGVDWLVICAGRLGRDAIDVVQGKRKGLDAILRGFHYKWLPATCCLLSV